MPVPAAAHRFRTSALPTRRAYGVAPTLRGDADSSVTRVGSRRCSRAGCPHPATATLTYAYRDSTAVLGPLASRSEPHGYDLCHVHAQTLSAPRGWEVIRLAVEEPAGPSTDDLLALADAVREVGLSYDPPPGPDRDRSRDPGGAGSSSWVGAAI